MPEEVKGGAVITNPSETGKQVDDQTVDYLAAIKELKENTVSKVEYDKLKLENKKLLGAVVNGQTVEMPKTEEKKDKIAKIDAIRGELFNPDNELSNLDFVSKALELRDALIDIGEPDPFLPIGRKISPTDDDVAKANHVAQVFKECIEYAEGDSRLFTSELDRRTNDVKIPLRR